MKTLLRGLLAIWILLAASTHAATITSLTDGFEGDGFEIDDPTLANWDITGSIDTVGPGAPSSPLNTIVCNGSQTCVDLDGTGGPSSGSAITTKDDFAPGTYTVRFDVSGNQRNGPSDTMTVAFGDLSHTITKIGSAGFETITLTAVVMAGDKLSFSHVGNDQIGLILDNVHVSPVPLPAAAWLFLTGIGGLIAIRRRRLGLA